MLQRIPVSALLVFGAWAVASGALVSSQGQELPFKPIRPRRSRGDWSRSTS